MCFLSNYYTEMGNSILQWNPVCPLPWSPPRDPESAELRVRETRVLVVSVSNELLTNFKRSIEHV